MLLTPVGCAGANNQIEIVDLKNERYDISADDTYHYAKMAPISTCLRDISYEEDVSIDRQKRVLLLKQKTVFNGRCNDYFQQYYWSKANDKNRIRYYKMRGN